MGLSNEMTDFLLEKLSGSLTKMLEDFKSGELSKKIAVVDALQNVFTDFAQCQIFFLKVKLMKPELADTIDELNIEIEKFESEIESMLDPSNGNFNQLLEEYTKAAELMLLGLRINKDEMIEVIIEEEGSISNSIKRNEEMLEDFIENEFYEVASKQKEIIDFLKKYQKEVA